MSRVNADLEALKELREAVDTFTLRQKEALETAEREINITLTMLEEAERYWYYQIEERQHYLEQCQREAAAAAIEGYYLDYSSYASALQEAQENHANIKRWQQRVDEEVFSYHRARGNIAYLLENDMWRAARFLDNRIKALEAYYANSLSSSSPVLSAVGSAVGAGIAAVIGGVIKAVQSSQRELHGALGSIGEEVAVQVLSTRFGLQPASTLQEMQGFERVYSAPGMPLMVMEGKANKEFTGQNIGGRIALLARQFDAENTPAVTVITDPVKGLADVYTRRDDGTWQFLRSGTDLNQLLSTSFADSAASNLNKTETDDSTKKG